MKKKIYHTLSKSSDNCFCSIKTVFLNHLHFMWSREDKLKKNKANWDTWDISLKADFLVNLTSQRFICNPLNLKRIPRKITIILKKSVSGQLSVPAGSYTESKKTIYTYSHTQVSYPTMFSSLCSWDLVWTRNFGSGPKTDERKWIL